MFHVYKTLSSITAGLFSYWLPASATSLILFLRQNKHRHLTQNFWDEIQSQCALVTTELVSCSHWQSPNGSNTKSSLFHIYAPTPTPTSSTPPPSACPHLLPQSLSHIPFSIISIKCSDHVAVYMDYGVKLCCRVTSGHWHWYISDVYFCLSLSLNECSR